MSQAARLNLRMQKEIKLLLTDPPPGVSILNLDGSALPATSSLTSFEAQMRGPEGTVYSKGLFKINIQIPERYPFQPPNVTFGTPIYHPNIDNGGRICLDILNLPPKGAWQPSLNISTVLTSIGLLLSEPNPDDGLMCEASREYKYNRQYFDQKARGWTEKYAQNEMRSSINEEVESNLVDKAHKDDAKDSQRINQHSLPEVKPSLKILCDKESAEPTSHFLQLPNCNDKREMYACDKNVNTARAGRLSLSKSKVLSLSQRDHQLKMHQTSHQDADLGKVNGESVNEKVESSEIKEVIVVSDSEESEEEDRGQRSRLNIRKRLRGIGTVESYK